MAGSPVVLGAALGYASVQVQGRGRSAGRQDRRHPAADAVRPVRLPGLQALRPGHRQGRGRNQPVPARRRGGHPQAGRPARARIQAALRRARRRKAEVGRGHRRAPASAARCASRPARSMPSSAPPSRCTPWSRRCAPAANCAWPPCPVDCIAMVPVAETVDTWKWKYPVVRADRVRRTSGGPCSGGSRLMLHTLFKFHGGVKAGRPTRNVTTRADRRGCRCRPRLVMPLHQSIGGTPRPLVKAGDTGAQGPAHRRADGNLSSPRCTRPPPASCVAVEMRPDAARLRPVGACRW
jgi:hypothetical protein